MRNERRIIEPRARVPRRRSHKMYNTILQVIALSVGGKRVHVCSRAAKSRDLCQASRLYYARDNADKWRNTRAISCNGNHCGCKNLQCSQPPKLTISRMNPLHLAVQSARRGLYRRIYFTIHYCQRQNTCCFRERLEYLATDCTINYVFMTVALIVHCKSRREIEKREEDWSKITCY